MTSHWKKLPNIVELLWMLYMQPVSLHDRLRACGIEEPGASAWKLWRARGDTGDFCRLYVMRLMTLLLLATPIFGGAAAGALSLAGFAVNWLSLAVGVIAAVSLGMAAGVVAALALSVATNMAGGVVFGVAAAGATGEAPIWHFGLGFDVALGVAVGVSVGLIIGVARGVSRGVARGLTSVASGVIEVMILSSFVGVAFGAVFGVVFGLDMGVAMGLAGTSAFILASWRIPIYAVESMISIALYAAQRFLGTSTLRFTPVLHHELSYLPLPFLGSHLLLSAGRDPALVRRVLDACAIAPGQRETGRNVLAALQARELAACARDHKFSLLTSLELGAPDHLLLRWLPSLEGADPLDLSFREAARYFAAAESSRPHHRLGHIRRAEAQLQSLDNDLLSDSPLARALRPTLQIWKSVAADTRRQAERAAAGFLPNPFRPGNALDPEQGREVFRGRKEIARQIEGLLADPTQSLSIALLGPRRSGKSSLLKMLPALLPDAVCIFFDLQDHPVDSPAGFFREFARTARDQARRDRRLDLPPLPESDPFEAGSAWFRALDEHAGSRRILLCIDEFERLESLFPGDHGDILRLMGLFRATIQHRRRLRLLVSGAAPFDELSEMWNDHFINVQELRLDLLDESTSIDLLMRPVPEFPDDAISEPVAREVFARTGGQPLLLQAFGDALVSRLNDQQSEPRRASLADVDAVQEQILQRYRPFFADTMNPKKMPPAARAALLALAHGHAPELDTRTRRWLRQRCLLTADDRLRVPMLGAWIREEGLDMDQ